MARTKAEVRAFLDGLVGRTCVDKSNGALNGQCVCLIKNLMDFLGVPNPYGARGNAKDAGDSYIREGIGTSGKGWLTVVVNRDMGLIGGVRYGHIWCDLQGEANYESNGNRALIVTKNTRPFSQGQQFINFDKWIGEDVATIGSGENWYWRFNRLHHQLVRNGDLPRSVFNQIIGLDAWKVIESWSDHPESDQLIKWQEIGERADKDNWPKQIYDLQDVRNAANAEILQLKQKLENSSSKAEVDALKSQLADAQSRAKTAQDALNARIEEEKNTDNAITAVLRSLWKRITGVS